MSSTPRKPYPPGTPNWVELRAADHEAAVAFYGQLFDWRFAALDLPDRRPYAWALRDGEPVAAITAADDGEPGWRTFLAVDDLEVAGRAVVAAGGALAGEPHDLADHARVAVVRDPAGATVGLWRADRHPGAAVLGGAGAAAWFELLTPDVEAAAAFYERAFGVSGQAAVLAGIPWIVLSAAGSPVAGVVRGAGGDSRWHVYFGADDVAAVARRAVELGGRLLVGPVDTPIGPMAGCADPHGARFSLWAARPAP
jgi:predicted enzyme related to lactoylglutathione lyase